MQNWFVRSSDKDGQSLNRNEVTTKPSVILVPEAHRETENGQNFNGDASHREAEDESATVSKNMRRVPQNEAPAHGFSGGRAAQGTMSRSPEAAAQSGKDYDQETDR